MRTVITGGAGFIGSHLCERLLAEGHDVIAVDNMITGDLANLDHLRANPRFRFIGHDISSSLKVRDKLDNVLHFASPASPVDYLEHPIPTLKVGALGTHNTLGLALAHEARLPARQHQRGIRRSAPTPADRGVLGQRQPHRHARLLRRGQEICRVHRDGVPPRPQD